jgi:hypothetical protein
MAVKYEREALTTPGGLTAVLQDLFPHFADQEFLEELQTGETNLHTVMREFCSSFDAARSSEAQLIGLAKLMKESISEDDNLANAVGTCFLEHLRQVDRKNMFWKYLPADVRSHIRAGCLTSSKR